MSSRQISSSLFVCAQLLVPAVLLTLGRDRIPTDFAWDMFSHRMQCERFQAYARIPDKEIVQLDVQSYVPTTAALRRVLYPGRLEAFRQFLCSTVRISGERPLQVAIVARCSTGRDAPPRILADGNRRTCSAT